MLPSHNADEFYAEMRLHSARLRKYSALTSEQCDRVIEDPKVARYGIRSDPDALDILVEHFRGKPHAKDVTYLDSDSRVQTLYRMNGVVVEFNHSTGEVTGGGASSQSSGDIDCWQTCCQSPWRKAV